MTERLRQARRRGGRGGRGLQHPRPALAGAQGDHRLAGRARSRRRARAAAHPLPCARSPPLPLASCCAAGCDLCPSLYMRSCCAREGPVLGRGACKASWGVRAVQGAADARIAEQGVFKYVLLRVSAPRGGSRLLVRGALGLQWHQDNLDAAQRELAPLPPGALVRPLPSRRGHICQPLLSRGDPGGAGASVLDAGSVNGEVMMAGAVFQPPAMQRQVRPLAAGAISAAVAQHAYLR